MKVILLMGVMAYLPSHILAQADTKKSQMGTIILDNENVKVTSFESQPGKDMCGIGKHSHGAHLTVLLTDATITVTMADGRVVTNKLPAGSTFWSEPETHVVVNSGKNITKAQLIEYKKPK